MIELKDLRRPLISLMKSKTGNEVIMGDTTGDVPAFPYTSLMFTTSGIEIGGVSEVVTESLEGAQITAKQDQEFVVSITCHGIDNESSFNLSSTLKSYFISKGPLDLASYNIALVECTPVINRDVFLTIEYERRWGFDIRLRVTSADTYSVEAIELIDN